MMSQIKLLVYWRLIAIVCTFLDVFIVTASTQTPTETSACIDIKEDNGLLCFKTLTKSLAWAKAKKSCQTEQYRLAVVDSPEKQRALDDFRKVPSSNGDPMWIGMSTVENQWKWNGVSGDFDPMTDFSNWADALIKGAQLLAPKPKAEYCVAVHNSKWKPYPCDTPFRYICTKWDQRDSTTASLPPREVSDHSFWIKIKTARSRRYKGGGSLDGIDGQIIGNVSSATSCAMRCKNVKQTTCTYFNYSQVKQACVLITKDHLITRDTVEDADWDIWTRKNNANPYTYNMMG